MIAATSLDSLITLIECMEQTPRLTDDAVTTMYQQFSAKMFDKMEREQVNWGEARGGTLSFLSNIENKPAVIARDDDFDWQLGVVSGSFSEFLTSGEVPPPYYPWRLCIILRKARRSDLEYRFLCAWEKHFSDRGVGKRYAMLSSRLAKLEQKHEYKNYPRNLQFIATSASAQDCKSIKDAAARLVCFDKTAAPTKHAAKPAPNLTWYKKLALENKSRLFRDPDSLREVKIGHPYDCSSRLGPRQCICFEANGRNAYGGMTGLDTYVASITQTTIEMSGKMYEPAACGKLESFPQMNGRRK